jgi:hypothetical protein
LAQTKHHHHHHVGLHEGGTTVIRHCSLTINLFKPPVKSLPLSLQGEDGRRGSLVLLNNPLFKQASCASLGHFLFRFNSRYTVALWHLMVFAISDTEIFRSKRTEIWYLFPSVNFW